MKSRFTVKKLQQTANQERKRQRGTSTGMFSHSRQIEYRSRMWMHGHEACRPLKIRRLIGRTQRAIIRPVSRSWRSPGEKKREKCWRIEPRLYFRSMLANSATIGTLRIVVLRRVAFLCRAIDSNSFDRRQARSSSRWKPKRQMFDARTRVLIDCLLIRGSFSLYRE